MGKLGLDVTTGGLVPDNTYTATVDSVELQIKTGAKFNKDGTTTVDAATFENAPTQGMETDPDTGEQVLKAKSRVHFMFKTEKGNVFHDVYMNDKSMEFIKKAWDALGVVYDKDGFDPNDIIACVGKQVIVDVIIDDDGKGNVNNKVVGLKRV